MDQTDRKIIEELKKNGRASFTDIAKKIDVSEGTVRNRVQRLQDQGVIQNFTVNVQDPGAVQAFVSVNVSTDREFGKILEEFPDDVELFELAGDIDILVKLSRNSSSEINDAVDKIRAIQGVEETNTYMVLSEAE